MGPGWPGPAGGWGETFLAALVILSGSKSVPGMFLIPGSVPAPAAPAPASPPPPRPTQPSPTAAPGPSVGGSAPHSHAQGAPMGAPALGGAPQSRVAGMPAAAPVRGPGLTPTAGPAAGRHRVPSSCQGHAGSSSPTQCLAEPCQRRLAPAATAGRSHRAPQRVAPPGSMGLGAPNQAVIIPPTAWEQLGEQEATVGVPVLWGPGATGVQGGHVLPHSAVAVCALACVHACLQGVRCGGWLCKGAGVQEAAVQPPCAPGPGVCLLHGRAAAVAGAVGVRRGPRVCREGRGSRQPLARRGCFLAHPPLRGLGWGGHSLQPARTRWPWMGGGPWGFPALSCCHPQLRSPRHSRAALPKANICPRPVAEATPACLPRVCRAHQARGCTPGLTTGHWGAPAPWQELQPCTSKAGAPSPPRG